MRTLEARLESARRGMTSAVAVKKGYKKYACGDCEWVGGDDELTNDITDLSERVAAGELMPAGECPDCGALAYLTGFWIAALEA